MQPSFTTHARKLSDVRSAIVGPIDASIILSALVDIFAIQIGEPCLDAPSGYENRDLVFPLRGLDIGVPAFFIKRRYAGIHATGIAINHDDEHTLDVIASAPVRLQFPRKAPAHESFRRPLARWGPLDAKLPFVPAHPPEKPPREHFVLLIFEQQDELDSPAHRSHPRAQRSPHVLCQVYNLVH